MIIDHLRYLKHVLLLLSLVLLALCLVNEILVLSPVRHLLIIAAVYTYFSVTLPQLLRTLVQ